MNIVLALGMSSPLSMIVVASSMSQRVIDEIEHDLLQFVARASGRGRRRCAPRARSAAAAGRGSRCPGRDCGRRTSARRGSIRAAPHGESVRRSKRATRVSTARRSAGGVSRFEMSRSPSSDMCSVRGMGVAVIVSTSTIVRSALSRSLTLDAEPLLFVDNHQPEVVEAHVGLRPAGACRSRCRLDPSASRSMICRLFARSCRTRLSTRDLERETRPSAR